ncbi:MAG: hypothetical protein M1830_004942 [Pleopsidium flavum]|nr:MAG: hypothetical protein M1830_004942 [Pleopsidium flavum]
MHFPAALEYNIDIEKYILPFIPRSRLHLLPRSISHFLGYRNTPRKEIGNLLVAAWSFLGAFCGVAIIEGTFMSPVIQAHGTPLIIGSFITKGAAAILEYNTIESPLAQPRNSIIGHFISAVVGVGITKLFELHPNFETLRWVAGAMACGLASAAMVLTKTVHPPAGATALLAAVDPTVSRLGWYLLPLVLLSTMLTLASALLINNIQRQFPIYWFTPVDLSKGTDDVEKTPTVGRLSIGGRDGLSGGKESENQIIITSQRIFVPDHLFLAAEEKGILEILRDRLHEGFQSSQDLELTPAPSKSSDQTDFSKSTC